MSKKDQSHLPQYPRAPPLPEFENDVYMQRAAPPSYEESIRQQAYYQMQPQMQAGVYTQLHNYSTYGHPQVYNVPTMNSQPYVTAQPPMLELAKGATVRTTATGAVSIPPPPPGMAPTPAQWAAMQGQSVLVKEPKKRSFFS